jgi:nucleoid-associated protein YgaU
MRHGAARQREIERAMRAHPAGRALRSRAAGYPPPGADGALPEGCVAPGPLRLTARGRRLAVSLAVAGGVGAAALVHGLLPGDGARGLHLAGETSVVVHPGDSLWSIASSVAGDDDVRVVVDRIREVNGLHGSDLVPGEVLRLP